MPPPPPLAAHRRVTAAASARPPPHPLRSLVVVWISYIVVYFTNTLSYLLPVRTKRSRLVGLWETAMATRAAWVRVSGPSAWPPQRPAILLRDGGVLGC